MADGDLKTHRQHVGKGQTTDGTTPLVLFSVPMATNNRITTVRLWGSGFLGGTQANRKALEFDGTILLQRESDGTITVVDTNLTTKDTGTSGYAITAAVNGSNVEIRATGASSETVTWWARGESQEQELVNNYSGA